MWPALATRPASTRAAWTLAASPSATRPASTCPTRSLDAHHKARPGCRPRGPRPTCPAWMLATRPNTTRRASTCPTRAAWTLTTRPQHSPRGERPTRPDVRPSTWPASGLPGRSPRGPAVSDRRTPSEKRRSSGLPSVWSPPDGHRVRVLLTPFSRCVERCCPAACSTRGRASRYGPAPRGVRRRGLVACVRPAWMLTTRRASTRRASGLPRRARRPVARTARRVRAPDHVDHRFRAKPITDSGASRSPVPDHADHRFRPCRSPAWRVTQAGTGL